MKIENYQQANKFITSRTIHGIKPGLGRMRTMLLDIKYKNKAKIIHVTGTNGKGSTTAYIAAGLLTSNKNIGTFTSPSLTGLTGHFTLNNEEMSADEFVYYLNKLLPFIKKLDDFNNHPSEFEILTMIAILYFEDNADYAVVETGMGGLLDTTNVLHPVISVITSISIDHQAFLGNTLAEITKHKAGIIKENTPVVLGELTKESLEIVEQRASAHHSKLYRLGYEFTVKKIDDTHKFTETKTSIAQLFKLQNKGVYQSKNASIALQAILILSACGLNINLTSCAQAIGNIIISNRYEIIHRKPRIIIDGAHNVASMQAFLETVEQELDCIEKHLIISAFKDKPLKEMITLAKGKFKTITVTTFEHERAYLKEELECLNLPVIVNPNWFDLINEIKNKNGNNLSYYIVGSVFFTNLVKKAINNQS